MQVRIGLNYKAPLSMLGLTCAAELALLTLVSGSVLSTRAFAAEPAVSFEKQVFPIFEKHCIQCHSTGGVGQISSSLDLTSYKELRMGSIGGVALVPYHSDRSPIMRYLKDNWNSSDKNALRMPPLGPQLPPDELKTISDWIDQGAKNN